MTWTLDPRDPRCGLNVTASLPLVTVPVLHVHAEAGGALVDVPCSIHHLVFNTLMHGRPAPCAAGDDSAPRGTLEHWYTMSKHPNSPLSRSPAPRATTAPTTRRRRSELTWRDCGGVFSLTFPFLPIPSLDGGSCLRVRVLVCPHSHRHNACCLPE